MPLVTDHGYAPQYGFVTCTFCSRRRSVSLAKFKTFSGNTVRSTTCMVRHRVALRVEYIGSKFHGWERKPDLRTVQGTIEDAIAKVSGESSRTVAASKTDAGTHAIGQILHFDTRTTLMGSRAWEKAINARLPTDVTVASSALCDKDRFHARADAIWRRYRYTIVTSRSPPPIFLNPFVWHYYNCELDDVAMNSAVQCLVASENSIDLSAFRKSGSAATHTNIKCYQAFVRRPKPDIIEIELTADWFVYGMMRLLTAALVEVGKGLHSIKRFKETVSMSDRSLWKYSAPASGLCLLEVGYRPGLCPLQNIESASRVYHLGLSDFQPQCSAYFDEQ